MDGDHRLICPPAWSLNSATGVISGTPSTAGAPTFTVTLTDADNKTATESLTLTVAADPSVTSTTVADGEVGVPYNQSLAGAAGTAPYSWTVTAGSLPTGLSLDSAIGVISGTPSTAGAPTFTVTLTDADSQTAEQSYTMTVLNDPSVTTTTLPDGEVGVFYNQTVAGSGGSAPYAWSLTAGTLPAGLSLNSCHRGDLGDTLDVRVHTTFRRHPHRCRQPDGHPEHDTMTVAGRPFSDHRQTLP
jgi:hypothetical protein